MDLHELRGPWSDDQVHGFLEAAVIPMRIAVQSPSGWPLVVSLWYLAEGAELLAATRPDATLVRCLERDPRCGFEVAGDLPPYRGVRGRATATLDRVRGGAILEHLLHRYLGGVESPLARQLLAKASDEVCIRLQPHSLVSWDFSRRMESSLPEPPSAA